MVLVRAEHGEIQVSGMAGFPRELRLVVPQGSTVRLSNLTLCPVVAVLFSQQFALGLGHARDDSGLPPSSVCA